MTEQILRTVNGSNLKDVAFDPEYSVGACSAVRTCLRIQPNEKVTVITDDMTKDIAASIVAELEQVGCPYNAFVLEDLAPRPLIEMPEAVLADMETSQVSIFAVNVQRNELKSRMQMTDVVNRRRMRHAHMVNINPQIMLEGMRADFHAVDRISSKVLELVSKAKVVKAKTAAGDGPKGGSESGVSLAQDERDYKSGQVGQSTGRRSVHDSGRSERHVRDRRRRRRLSLREVWRLERQSIDDPRGGQPPDRGA
jgi:hypothetical protein